MKRLGLVAMTNAERQKKHREKLKALHREKLKALQCSTGSGSERARSMYTSFVSPPTPPRMCGVGVVEHTTTTGVRALPDFDIPDFDIDPRIGEGVMDAWGKYCEKYPMITDAKKRLGETLFLEKLTFKAYMQLREVWLIMDRISMEGSSHTKIPLGAISRLRFVCKLSDAQAEYIMKLHDEEMDRRARAEEKLKFEKDPFDISNVEK